MNYIVDAITTLEGILSQSCLTGGDLTEMGIWNDGDNIWWGYFGISYSEFMVKFDPGLMFVNGPDCDNLILG